MKKQFITKIAMAICGLGFSLLASAQTYPGYTLVWADEFNGGYTNGDVETGLDLNTWSFETGGGGWGTGQLDYATTDVENVEVSGGTLKVRTQRNNPNQSNEYTSGRINSKNKQSFLYGKVEARIRTVNMTESGRGFAFWMMPNGLPAGASTLMWPQGGEMDVFEYNGLYPQYNLGSVHYAWKWLNNTWGGDANHAHAGGIYNPIDRSIGYVAQGRDGCTGPAMTTNKTNLLGATYHIYGVNWYNDRIEFYVDQDIYHTFFINKEIWCGDAKLNDLGRRFIETGYNFDKIADDATIFNQFFRPFENPFYIILSAGVGGANTYGGNITSGTNPAVWTCTTEIDWVHVYKQTDVNPPVIQFDQAQYDAAAGNITVTPTKVSGDNIAKIEYFVNSWQNKAKSATGTSFVWNQTTAGCYTLYVRACNAAGYWGNWTTVKYSVGGGCVASTVYDYYIISRDNLNGLSGTVLDCRKAADNWGSDFVFSSNCSPAEGTASLCFDSKAIATAGWQGFALPSGGSSYDLSLLGNYSMHFKVRTNYPGNLKIVINQATGNEGTYNLSSTSGDGLTLDNTWKEISIPLSEFTGLDLATNKGEGMLFGVFPPTFSASKHIEFDDVYLYKPISVGIKEKISDADNITILSFNQSIIIKNAVVGTPIKVYAINGTMKTSKVVSSDETIISLPTGYYVVCCGDKVQKVVVQ